MLSNSFSEAWSHLLCHQSPLGPGLAFRPLVRSLLISLSSFVSVRLTRSVFLGAFSGKEWLLFNQALRDKDSHFYFSDSFQIGSIFALSLYSKSISRALSRWNNREWKTFLWSKTEIGVAECVTSKYSILEIVQSSSVFCFKKFKYIMGSSHCAYWLSDFLNPCLWTFLILVISGLYTTECKFQS